MSIVIITEELPEGYIGEKYFFKLKANRSETSGLVWKIESGGALPADLSFSEDGVISGIPRRTERANYYIVVTDVATKESVGKHFRLVIDFPEPSDLQITTDSVNDAVVGIPYRFQFGCRGGTPPYTWSSDGLPIGLDFYKNGLIDGTAKFSGGLIPINVKLTDSDNNTESRLYFMNVRSQKK